MGLTKEQRICILLAIDSAFFLVELIVGYAVHSLALVADAFHMLNDVLSLCVGLWAVRVAQSGSSKTYTYGWQRAETLGALVNGVFLVALCVTIFLEAIQRFVEKPNVTNPQLVLIVGCLGLASNIVGLVLFHDVGHSHGPGQGHSHGDEEAGHAHTEGHGHEHQHDHSHATEQSPLMSKKQNPKSAHFSSADEDGTTVASNPTTPRKSTDHSGRHRRRTSQFGSVDNIQIHPASFRNDIINAARYQDEPLEEEAVSEDNDQGEDHSHDHVQHNHSGLRTNDQKQTYGATSVAIADAHQHHIHTQPKDSKPSSGGHGHSHGDLNMRGVFLHVMGDALGNIGVIATALIIWLTTFPGRFYFDPAVSLVITAIILASAIPLCKAASRILLQAVPMGLSIDEIRADIEDLPQVVEAHHLHVWQLSDTKLVASLHVKVDCEIKGAGSASYMTLAREIRGCLHGYGIHSSTIQPEFMRAAPTDRDLLNDDHEAGSSSSNDNTTAVNGNSTVNGGTSSKAGSVLSAADGPAADGHTAGPGCLMDCEDTCGSKGQCCPSTDGKGQG
ncbi:Zinc resistance conferring protein [Exophiala xenobiotica]|uniref:Zinc resistance conferring protein n=1 Tax=Lithohypha guttulata TaxID=1690604 RepID=A0ABR0K6R5_9EURO|nr:Zinc resistance conferring protein [Lithohypha guttulata]KAK5309420.1 Zinc resistance conferring protein [Exophiala xenobiotica]